MKKKKEEEKEGIIEETQIKNNKNNENENDINQNIEEEKIINNQKIKIVYENFDYFLSFIKTSSVENEVLIGYLYKILKHLILTKGYIIIPYLFKEKIEFLVQF